MQDFPSQAAATRWMLDLLEARQEEYVDNERFAFLDDPQGLADYERRAAAGCCGSFDEDILVAGRPARVGCNYGH